VRNGCMRVLANVEHSSWVWVEQWWNNHLLFSQQQQLNDKLWESKIKHQNISNRFSVIVYRPELHSMSYYVYLLGR